MLGLVMSKRIDDIDVEVGRRLRLLRIKHGVSQEALADVLGITFQQVQKYENGSNRMSAGKLQLIADTFNIPVGELFGEARARAKTREVEDMIDTAAARRLFVAFQQLDPAQRRVLVELAEQMAEK
jgi:transcriptional regulator with XRE-family HTH domain